MTNWWRKRRPSRRQREELYQIKATYQDQVMAMNDQVSRQIPLLPVSFFHFQTLPG